MHYRLIITLFLAFLMSAISAQDSTQNLLQNPSFELSQMKRPNFRFKNEIEFDSFSIAWTTQKNGSPDIIDSLKPYQWHEYGNMWAKRIIPHHGAKVVGLRLFGCQENNFIDCREYLVQKLKEPMIAGHYYRVELWTARIEKAFACQDLGVYFSDTLLRKDLFMTTRRFNPQIKCHAMPGRVPYVWYRLADTILAEKNFQAVYIGSFVNDNAATVDRIESDSYRQSYYFVDDVKLVDLGPPKVRKREKPITPTPVDTPLVKKKKPFVFKNLLFERGKADILPYSFAELDSIFNYIEINTNLKIKIEGHTDSEDTPQYNQQLSERRAKAVADYFIQKGISKDRISTEGFGETRHVSENTSQEGRQLNRRVEMFLNE